MIDQTRCPIDHTNLSARRMPFEREETAAPIAQDEDGVWHVYDHDIARQILRDDDRTRQAGFNAEQTQTDGNPFLKNLPVLFAHGEAHKAQRRAIARFFTPRATKKKHRPLMEQYADQLMAKLNAQGEAELSDLTMELAANVACDVVGLNNSHLPGRNRRLNNFIEKVGRYSIESQQDGKQKQSVQQWFGQLSASVYMGLFFFLDVRPAIAKRKRNPQDDVISHLIEQAYSPLEILVECVTYGTAGMVTTREFIVFAAWHMLQNEALREQYINGEEKERHQILEEILRVEPIVGHLYRRTVAEIEIQVGEGEEVVTVPAGALLDLHIATVNVDEGVVGEAGDAVCPMRPLSSGVLPPVMSFGDGHHRCPGAYIAIEESDVFLTRLLQQPNLRLISDPIIQFEPIIESHETRNFIIAVG